MFSIDQHYQKTPIVIDDFERKLYAQDVNQIVTEFSKVTSCGRKKLAFCLCTNSIPSLAGYISMLETGIVPVMIDATKNIDLLDNLYKLYRPQLIWSPTITIKENRMSCITESYTFEGYSLYTTPFDMDSYSLHNDLAILLTTSGSTGSPKLVKLTQKNILSNAESIAAYLGITSEDRPITSLPMYYSYGLSVINSHLIKGATILLTDKAVIQKEFWDFAKREKATSIAGVPYTYEMLRRLRVFKLDLPSLKTMTQAGGKLNPKIAEEYIRNAKECGKRFIVMYGQTEATARMSYLPWEHAEEKYASIGVAIPGGRFSLIDVNGNEIIKPNIDGELVYEGPNVSLGYAECIKDLAKGDENHGILHTGDIAYRDEDGYYYITGRMKRFVKVWGNRCNLDATEQLVKNITTNCACAGVDDLITVFVTEKGLETQIKNFLSEKMGLNTRAFSVKVIDSIPKNNSGKVLYSELQKMLD